MEYLTPLPPAEQIQQDLQICELFTDLLTPVLQHLVERVQYIRLGAGEVLFRQNDPSDALYVVVHGNLRVTMEKPDGTEAFVADLEAGQPVGEMQILTGGQRTATVIATQETTLVRLEKSTFEHLIQESPQTVTHLTNIVRRRLMRNQLLALLPELFGIHTEVAWRDIGDLVEWVQLGDGQTLFRQGDIGDSMYIVVNGRLQVVVETQHGDFEIVGELSRGELIGEVSMFTHEGRTATVRSVRDSVLARISKPVFERITRQYPQMMFAITETLIDRLRNDMRRHRRLAGSIPKNIAVIGHRKDAPVREFCRRLVQSLRTYSSVLYLNNESLDQMIGWSGAAELAVKDPYNIRLITWLDDQEIKYDFLVYEADPGITAWTERALQQADLVLILAEPHTDPSPGAIEMAFLSHFNRITLAQKALVLIHPPDTVSPSGTRLWLAERTVASHHHLRGLSEEDIDRLARIISGRAIGLVLGGGGARGLAHIGVIRALQEAGIPIDVIGGTSAGAYIAAQYAMGWDHDELYRQNKAILGHYSVIKDLTLPVMALLSKRKIDKLMQNIFGERRLEDLWINCFAISCNLSNSDTIIHRTGPVWEAIRATTALPGVVPPVIKNHQVYIDGGVLDNLPAGVIRKMARGLVISVNVIPDEEMMIRCETPDLPSPWTVLWHWLNPFQKALQVPNLVHIIMRTQVIRSINQGQVAAMEADIYLKPPIDDFGLLEFTAIDQLVQTGYEYAKTQLDAWEHSDQFEDTLALILSERFRRFLKVSAYERTPLEDS